MKTITSFFCAATSAIICAVGVAGENPYTLLVAVAFVLAAIIIYSLDMKNSRMGYLIFACSVFAFLLSRTFSNALRGLPLEEYFKDQMSYKSILCIITSLYALYVGEHLFASKRMLLRKRIKYDISDEDDMKAIGTCKALFYIGAVCQVIMLVVRILLVRTYGYEGSYLEMSASVAGVPYIITKLADFYISSFIVMLAFLPNLKKIKDCIITYVAIAALSLLTGARNGFFVPMVFLFWYFSYRKGIGLDKGGAKRGMGIMKILILGYLGTILIAVIGIVRVGGTIDSSIFDPFNTIAENIGASNLTLLRTFAIEKKIPDEFRTTFIFGPFYNFLNNNIISQMLFGTQVDAYGTVAYAMNGHNYGSYLTYTFNQMFYMEGGGFGSSYIAEGYLVGGMTGIAVLTLFYAYFISIPYRLKKHRWIVRALVLYMVYWFFYTPRDAALYFLTAGLNITNIVVIFIVWFFSEKKARKTGV